MSDWAIKVEDLGKSYCIRHKGGRRNYSLRESVAHTCAAPFRAVFGKNGSGHPTDGRPAAEDFWALRNVSFEVKPGEVAGIIGRNGAGKSTLLKILSRITEPTEGQARIRGRVASLLEVGTGFHGELSGRENIYLNGAILGMRRAEISRKFDEIVAFSEVEKFLDTPVKRYSSGMYMRLAFAVAAHLEPEILIVDEVLAVGDAAFQKKCLGKIKDVAEGGRTVLFVSHNTEAIRSLCQRGIWLKNGRVHSDGKTDEVVEAYFENISTEPTVAHANPVYGLAIHTVKLKNSQGEETGQFRPGEDLLVEISYTAQTPVEKPYLTVGVLGIYGTCFTANMLLDGARPDVLSGSGTLVCRFKSIPLLPQSYTVKLAIRPQNGVDTIMDYQEVSSFRVVGNLTAYGYKGAFLERASRYTPVVVPYEWQLPDGTNTAISLGRPTA